MLKREDLEKRTKVELREFAKELNIVGRWDMTKSQLVDAILETKNAVDEAKIASNDVSVTDEIKTDNTEKNVEADAKIEKKSADIETDENEFDRTQKEPYLKDAKVGSLVAFKLKNGKVKSAKIIKKSTAKRRFKVETEYGATYIISFDDVLWIRTGKRWPRGVYKALKGLTEDGKNEGCEES